jgi:acyl-CoA synthetase (AMP-forming)/AMP-acid ligase II
MESVTVSDRLRPLEPPFTPTIPVMLHTLADRYEDHEAQVSSAGRMTFRELERRSALYARGLLAQGLGKGSRIALLMPNGPEFTVAFMAAARIGALVAPLSTLYQAPELSWVLNHADIQMLLVSDRYLRHDYLGRLEQALPSLAGQSAGELVLPEAPYLRSILVWGECDRDWAAPGPAALAEAAAAKPGMDDAFLAAVEANVVPADLLCIIHTSGSTAEPKGVVHSHGPMIRHSYQKAHLFWALGEGDRIISTRPFFWIAGLTASLFHSLLTGCCLIAPDDGGSAEAVVKLIETERATGLCGDAGWIRSLGMNPVIEAAGYEIFRLSTDCAAFAVRTPAGPRFINPLQAIKTPAPTHPPEDRFARSYGMTETISAHTTVPANEILPEDRIGSCGQPVPGVILRIVDPNTRLPLEPGTVGELLVGGYTLMQGLYKKEREDTFTERGLYATGDLCSIDAQGYLTFNSRIGEMIKVHGANVAPMEVETSLNALPQIERSAVIGLTAADGGALLVAAVQVRPSEVFDEGAIRDQLRQRLSSYKVPKRLFALAPDEFPLTGSGKIRKSDLEVLLIGRLQKETVSG